MVLGFQDDRMIGHESALSSGTIVIGDRAARGTRLGSGLATKIVTGAISLIAMAAACAYLLAPAGTAWAITVRANRAPNVPAGHEIIYGTVVGSDGQPLSGIEISVDRKIGKKLDAVLTVKSGSHGTFRVSGRLRAAAYTVVVLGRSGHRELRGSDTLRLAPGYAYRITVRLVRTDVLLVFPVRTY